MSCSDARRNGVFSRGLDNVPYSIIYLHFQTETIPHCFNKSVGGSEKGRSSLKTNGVVFGGANQAHAQIIGNLNTRVNRGGVVIRKASGVVFCLSDDMQFRSMKRRLRRIFCSYIGLTLTKGWTGLGSLTLRGALILPPGFRFGPHIGCGVDLICCGVDLIVCGLAS